MTDPRRDRYKQLRAQGLSPEEAYAQAQQAEDFSDVTGRGASTADPNRDTRGVLGKARDWAVRPALQGASFGFSDELRGVGAALVPGGDDYTTARDKERAALDRAHDEAPVISRLAEFAGGVAVPVGAYGQATKGAGNLARIAAGAKIGAATGALGGVGISRGQDGEIETPLDVLPEAAIGGAMGGAVGGVLPMLGAGRRALKQTPAVLRETVEGVADGDGVGQALVKSIGRRAGVLADEVADEVPPPKSLREVLERSRDARGMPGPMMGPKAPTPRLRRGTFEPGLDDLTLVDDLQPMNMELQVADQLAPPVAQSPGLKVMGDVGPVERGVADRLAGNPIAQEIQALGVGPDEIERILNYTPDEYRAWVESMRRSQSGPTRSRLRADEERMGLPSVTPEPPRSRPDLGPEPSLEELLAQSLESRRPKDVGVAEMTPAQRNQAQTNARRDAADKVWSDRRERWGEFAKANPATGAEAQRKTLERSIRDLEKQVQSETRRGVRHVGFTERQLQRRREELRDLLKNERGRIGPEYGGSHRPPRPGDDVGAPVHDLTGNGLYPEDVYSSRGAQIYGDRNGLDESTLAILRSLRGNPEATVTVYRAIPRGTASRSIDGGDWVTVNQRYAQQHGESVLGGDYQIVSKKVKAKELLSSGDSLHEQGYWPADETGRAAVGMLAGTGAAAGSALTGGLLANRKRENR